MTSEDYKDRADDLAQALFGRDAKARDLVGGSNASIFVAARARILELEKALEPFSEFASVSVDQESSAWTSTIHREPVSTWFGPSDFRAARAALTKEKTP